MHVAHDLLFSINQAHRVLAPGGWLIAGESMRPMPGQPIHAELIFQILDSFNNVTTDAEIRPNPGFLTPQQWRQALRLADFNTVELTPNLEQIYPLCPYFYTGAICGQRSSSH
jgi:SAM-dependent methyltransferase